MQIRISPAPLSGTIKAIPSKSAAHRLLICAALGSGSVELGCRSLSKDIIATADCLKALGAEIEYKDGIFHVQPLKASDEIAFMDCGESGSTLRFLLPVVCALGREARIKMHGRLPERPLSPLWEELIAHGCELWYPEKDVLAVKGKLKGGSFRIRADVSSQFISGLLFALPLLNEDSSIELIGNIESAGYIDLTREAQKKFGFDAGFDGRIFTVPATAGYVSPSVAEVEGDWSNAAFWLVANELSSGELKISGLDENSAQGDKAVVQAIEAIKGGNAVIDVRDIPDLLPVLAVLAAVSPGRTEFINAGRLRIKESDRLKAVRNMLETLGGSCTELEDGLIIQGCKGLKGGSVDSANDHRIAMSAAVAAIACDEAVTVIGAEAVEKSYPLFWKDYETLGGQLI